MAGKIRMGLFVVVMALAAAPDFALASSDDDRFQFMKATENRVWRLDKRSGEIAVCTLNGQRLVCTTSSDAAMPPKKSYAQVQADADQQHDKDLAILERVFAFFRELITMAKEEK